jgi:hypothetical protein
MYQFNAEANLKPYARSRDNNVRNMMLRRGVITPNDTLYQLPVMITGTARSFIRSSEQRKAEIDSTAMSIDEFNFLIPAESYKV